MKPVKLVLWRKFLTDHGFEFKGIVGDHEKWSKAGIIRPVIFPIKDKELKDFFIRSNLKTIGLTSKQFSEWLNQK